MEINDRRTTTAAPATASSLPVSPTPGAPPPWATGAGAPPQGAPPPQQLALAPAPTDPLAAWRTSDALAQITAARAPDAPYPGAQAPAPIAIAWAAARNPREALAQWWPAQVLGPVLELLDGLDATARTDAAIAAMHGPPKAAPPAPAGELHPTARALLEHAIRQGATDEQIRNAYPHLTLAPETLNQLRYAVSVPTAVVTTPLDGALAAPAGTAPGAAPAGAGAGASDDDDAIGAGKTFERWSKGRRERAAVLFAQGATDDQVAGDIRMLPAKVAEYRAELAATSGASAAPALRDPSPTGYVVPVAGVPTPAPAPSRLPSADALAAQQTPTVPLGVLTQAETEGLRRLLARASDYDRYGGSDEEQRVIDEQLDATYAQIAQSDATEEQRQIARAQASRTTYRQKEALRSFPRAIARAVEEVRAELRAYEKLAALLPREG